MKWNTSDEMGNLLGTMYTEWTSDLVELLGVQILINRTSHSASENKQHVPVKITSIDKNTTSTMQKRNIRTKIPNSHTHLNLINCDTSFFWKLNVTKYKPPAPRTSLPTSGNNRRGQPTNNWIIGRLIEKAHFWFYIFAKLLIFPSINCAINELY